MTRRTIQSILPAQRDDIGDLKTVRALPTQFIDILDPFLFLNHHGPQVYPPQNRGLPFGPHPHRGFATVTFILQGELTHKDSAGHESTIKAGGVQWMTAGKGLVHSEISSSEFLKNGGPLEILQLWVNLPARLKMTQPEYIGLQSQSIPQLAIAKDLGILRLVSGKWEGQEGPIKPPVDVTSMVIELNPQASFILKIPSAHEVFFYIVAGEIEVNSTKADSLCLVRFAHEEGEISILAKTSATLLVCHAKPFAEPVVSHGPFVMNTEEEIYQAIRDYQAGKFEEM